MPRSTTGSLRLLLAASALLAVSACTERRTSERADSDLARDLALANQIDAQPALKDTAVTPPPAQRPQTPTTEAPRRVRKPQVQEPVQSPPPEVPPSVDSQSDVNTQVSDSASEAQNMPAPEMLIPAGAGIAMSSGMKVCSGTNKVGDKLIATVTSPVEGMNGALIPTGSRVVLEVARVAPDGPPDTSAIGFRPVSLYVSGASYPISGTVMSTTPVTQDAAPNKGVSDKTKVAGGAVAGAILGQLLGHDTKSTIVGAAAGAAAGAAVAATQKDSQVCLPQGASLVLTLADPVTMN